MKFDVVMLTKYDWANTGYRFYRCLKNSGLNVIFYKGYPHEFNYPEQGTLYTELINAKVINEFSITVMAPGLKELTDSASVLHFLASTLVITGTDYTQKKVVVQHGGSTYRRNPEASNAVFNPIASYSIMQFPTLLNKGAKNEHLIYYPVDTNFIKPVYRDIRNPLIVGHFPSTVSTKGTDAISTTVNSFDKNVIKYVGVNDDSRRTTWLNNLYRLSQCDIIVETVQPVLFDKPFCEWGNTALEAASLGKIVITNTASSELYKSEYGDNCELMIANNADELKLRLLEILNMSEEEIYRKQIATREWAVTNHGMEPTAKRLWDKVYGKLFTNREFVYKEII